MAVRREVGQRWMIGTRTKIRKKKIRTAIITAMLRMNRTTKTTGTIRTTRITRIIGTTRTTIGITNGNFYKNVPIFSG